MDGSQVCRVCLASGVRMHPADPCDTSPAPSLYQCYRDITGIGWARGVKYLCYECAWRTRRAHALREQSLRSHRLLERLSNSVGQITEETIKGLEPQVERVGSMLNIHHSYNVCEVQLVHEYTVLLKEEVEVKMEEMESDPVSRDSGADAWLLDVKRARPAAGERGAAAGVRLRGRGGAASGSSDDDDTPIAAVAARGVARGAAAADAGGAREKAKSAQASKQIPADEPCEAANKRKTKMKKGKSPKKRKSNEEFTTVAMTREDAVEEIKKRLDSSNYKTAKYRCDMCYRGFWQAATFENHMLKHDPRSGEQECDVCRLRFESRRNLQHHVTNYHRYKFLCKRCPHTSTTPLLARQHEDWHKGVLHKCQHCDINFKHATTLQTHVRRLHPSEVECDLCELSFAGERGVAAHKERAHRDDKPWEGSQDKPATKIAKRQTLPQSNYKDFSVITKLTREQQLEVINQKRETANYKNSPLKCNLCYEGFVEEAAFKNHMTRHDPASGEFECDICRRRFRLQRLLRKHFGHHTRRFACKTCPHVSTKPSQALLHQNWHKGTCYRCQHCGDTFLKFTTYNGHLRRKHPSRFVCELCGNAFVSEKGVLLHKSLSHSSEQMVLDGPYCAECDVRFASEEAFKKHLVSSTKHNLTNHYTHGCDECGQKFESRFGLRSHLLAEHGRKPRALRTQRSKADCWPRKCELCPEEVRSGHEHRQHFRRAHKDQNYPKSPGSFMCEVCGRDFKVKALLVYHLREHTGEKPYKCEFCPKRFTFMSNRNEHQLVHTGERPYPCDVCQKRFKKKCNRDRHTLVHTDSKPVACDACHKEFKCESSLEVHVKYVHRKHPYPVRRRRAASAAPSAPPAPAAAPP